MAANDLGRSLPGTGLHSLAAQSATLNPMTVHPAVENSQVAQLPATGRLILNADDWGRDKNTSQKILDCIRAKTVSSVSAMVFMDDSEGGAQVALAEGIDAGLHLNLTTAFSSANCTPALLRHHEKIARYLSNHVVGTMVFNPALIRSFDYVVTAQLDEYRRLYGQAPERIDGHHHMHLCANVLLARLLPAGTRVRRNFSFAAGEKSAFNRAYRRVVDGMLARRHCLTDYFFSLPPLEPAARLQRIFSFAERSVVEVETHPPNADEYRFLTGGEILRYTGEIPIAEGYAPRP